MVLLLLGTVVLGAGIFFLITFFTKKGERNSEKHGSSDEFEIIKLLGAEQSKWVRAAGVNSITFYEGNVDSQIIKNKLVSIVETNPWLSSRLIRTSRRYFFKYRKSQTAATIIDEHYKEIVVDNNQYSSELQFKEDSPMQAIFDHVEKDLIPPAVNCSNIPNAVLFRIVVVKIIEKGKTDISKTAFIPSLSHAVGDGYTFYQVYKMFDHNATITRFDPFRRREYDQLVKQRIGKEISQFAKSPFLIISAVISRLTQAKPVVMNFGVNKSVLEEKKKSYQAQQKNDTSKDGDAGSIKLPFISTNDLLTSWFFRVLGVESGFMPINYRNRLEGIDDSLVGNYEGVIFFSKKGFSEPQLIRSSLNTSRSEYFRIPTIADIWRFNFGIVTNWSSFYEDATLQEGHKLIYHSPLLTNSSVAMRGLMIIYSPRKGEIGVYIITQNMKTEAEWLQKSDFLTNVNYGC